MLWFKKRKKAEELPIEKQRLAQVIDNHLGRYVKIMNVNNSLKTGLIMFGLILFMWNIFMGSLEVKKTDHIASIAFTGNVSADNPLTNARTFSENFFRAVKDPTAKAIVIIANSGGGSPSQAEAINEMISKYTATPLEERKPVYVTIQDLCASACVMAMASADKIVAHASSLVGSIATRMDGWAIDKALKSFDIERKVITTGKYKDLFDPYRNVSESEKDFIRTEVMGPMHQGFVDIVKAGRGDKLDLTNEMLFQGMIWPGTDSVKVGLVDQIQTTYYMEEELMAQYNVTEVKRYNPQSKFSLKNLFTSSLENALRAVLTEELLVTM